MPFAVTPPRIISASPARKFYPIDDQIGLLHAADLDGDGLNDLIVANNLRSKINLLYNQTGKTNPAAANPPRKLEINELPPDARFRIDSIPSDERIASMVVTDLNGDGRPDIAYYGDPKELVVIYNQGTNGWSEPKHWPIEDGQLSAECAGRGRFERRRPHRPGVARRQRLAVFPAAASRTTRSASRKKFPIPARPSPCKSWTLTATAGTICCWWTGTARRRCVSGCKAPTASWGRKFISRRRPCARFARTTLRAAGKITS